MRISTPSASIFLAQLFSLLLFITTANALGGYMRSCKDFYINNEHIDGPIMTAHCKKKNGEYKYTVITVDDCFGNDDGKLIMKHGGRFLRNGSCEAELVHYGDFLGAMIQMRGSCKKVNGSRIRFLLDLDYVITNHNGNLYCDF